MLEFMIINGFVTPGYDAVRAAFAANFTEHDDIGAAVCVYRDGHPVLDLWGGSADPRTDRAWESDTTQLVYSATKGVTATAAHLLAQRGQLDLDAPVARYWPEFAAEGKSEIPVRWLLTHQAGLAALDKPVALADALAWQPIVDAFAVQLPNWTPGTAHGYHGRSFGWLVGEVVRRVTGRTVGQYVAEEIAGPFDIDFVIGVPDAERHRVSRLIFAPKPGPRAVPIGQCTAEPQDSIAALQDPNSLANRAFELTEPADMDFNSPATQAAQIPSSNGIGTARGLARLYAALIGEVDGNRLLTAEATEAAAYPRADGIDQVLMMPTRFSTGFMLPTERLLLGGPDSFGHTGRGGSLAYADPVRGIAFAYVTNHIIEGVPDLRGPSLVEALNTALDAA